MIKCLERSVVCATRPFNKNTK